MFVISSEARARHTCKGIILEILGDIEQIEILGGSARGRGGINFKEKRGWTLMKTSPPSFTFQLAWDRD